MDFITEVNGRQVENLVEELLDDAKFAWRERKQKVLKLAPLYKKAGFEQYAARAKDCGTFLSFTANLDGTKTLYGANFCQTRLCPMCTSRRARKMAYKLSQVMDGVEKAGSVKFIFLTLTIRNMEGDKLGDGIQQLTKAWDKLCRHRKVERAVKGWFRAVEITRNGRTYHPHIHAILAVPPEYFTNKELYLKHAEWRECWQKALRVDYKPMVRIQVAKADGEVAATAAAAKEAGKYAVKDSDYIDQRLSEKKAVKIVRDYTVALHRRRMTAFGGVMKDVAKALGAENMETDGDLVHTDETVREDIKQFIEIYRWNFGVGDYVLASRAINPEWEKLQEKQNGDG